MNRFYDWVLGDITWPKRLTTWRGTDGENRGVRVIASQIAISSALLEDAGIVPGHRRWPSIDELIFEDLCRGMSLAAPPDTSQEDEK